MRTLKDIIFFYLSLVGMIGIFIGDIFALMYLHSFWVLPLIIGSFVLVGFLASVMVACDSRYYE